MSGQSLKHAGDIASAVTVTSGGAGWLQYLDTHSAGLGIIIAFFSLVATAIFYIASYRINKREAERKHTEMLLNSASTNEEVDVIMRVARKTRSMYESSIEKE